MAFTVYLNGGPCNGTTKRLTNAQFKTQQTTCKGADYVYNSTQIISGHRYVFDVVVPESGGGGGSGNPAAYAPHVYRAWSDVELAVNRKMPSTLRRITIAQEATLRRLIHKRRVRH